MCGYITLCLESSPRWQMIARGQKVNLPVSLAGLGVRMAVSRKGSGIEGSKVDARRSSRAGIGIDGEHTAARPPERNICAPVMRREPLERPCKSLPKPSRNPRSHAWPKRRCRKIRYLHAHSSSALPCATSQRLSPPPSSIALASLTDATPSCLSSIFQRLWPARIAGRMRLIGGSRRL